MMIKNAIKCKKSGEVIESVSLHDFKICLCGACAVGGGHEYLRRSAPSLDDFIDLSVVKLDESAEKLFFCFWFWRLGGWGGGVFFGGGSFT